MKKGKQKEEYALHFKKLFSEIEVSEKVIETMKLYKYKGVFGSVTERKVGVFSNSEKQYTYGGKKHFSKPLTPFLTSILEKVIEHTGIDFNFVNVNYYPKGTSGRLTVHQDDEKEHASDVIASVSFGSTNNMLFYKERSGKYCKKISLEHGDLLLFHRMEWHAVGTSKNLKKDFRLNLTFRVFK